MAATALARAPRKVARTARAPRVKSRTPAPKDKTLSIRIDAETQHLIDRAAKVLGQNRTDFLLASARDRATEILLNQTFFLLPTADWKAFMSAMDNPPPPNAKLKALLARKMPWEAD